MARNICSGDGCCLLQVDCVNAYMKNADIACSHNCQPVQCPNYLICGRLEPEWLLYCHHGTCMNCAAMFGHLKFFENMECPICMDTKTCVKQIKCNHKICVDCFKRCHFPPYWNDPQPEFPYDSEVEDEYDSYWENPRWRNDPKIQKYEKELKEWEEERNNREESESYLKVCSLCRK